MTHAGDFRLLAYLQCPKYTQTHIHLSESSSFVLHCIYLVSLSSSKHWLSFRIYTPVCLLAGPDGIHFEGKAIKVQYYSQKYWINTKWVCVLSLNKLERHWYLVREWTEWTGTACSWTNWMNKTFADWPIKRRHVVHVSSLQERIMNV